jgi:hypothetical protein
MAYTQSGSKSGILSRVIGRLVPDGNMKPLPFANSFVTQDATATPVGSPLAMTGSTQTLVVPDNAVEIVINPSTAVVQVSEDSSMSVYFTVPVDTSQSFPVVAQQHVYLKGTSSDKVQFYFKTL